MKVFLAGGGFQPWVEDGFSKFYLLQSYLTARHSRENFGRYKDFILDSGIFSFLNGKDYSKIDWEEYAYGYATFVKERGIRNYVEIDIDRIVGLDNVEILRKKVERKVGWKCMPVWHINRGYDKWLEICRDYSYICFGAFLTDGLRKDKFLYIRKFLLDANRNRCKVHGLGFTYFDWLKRLKFYSVDSSSWTIGGRYGSVCQFKKDRIIAIRRPNGCRVADSRGLNKHNFYEWVKFQEYADLYL